MPNSSYMSFVLQAVIHQCAGWVKYMCHQPPCKVGAAPVVHVTDDTGQVLQLTKLPDPDGPYSR